MANQLFATKSLAQVLKEEAGENRLKRVLGPWALVALGVGAVIGAGIFVSTGKAAQPSKAALAASTAASASWAVPAGTVAMTSSVLESCTGKVSAAVALTHWPLM